MNYLVVFDYNRRLGNDVKTNGQKTHTHGGDLHAARVDSSVYAVRRRKKIKKIKK